MNSENIDANHGSGRNPLVLAPRVFAGLLFFIAAFFLAGGGQLLMLGGSVYYLVTGLLLFGAAVLCWRRSAWSAWIYSLVLAETLVWSLRESGLDGWALAPRLVALAVVGLWFFTPWMRRALSVTKAAWAWPLGLSVAACAGAIVLATLSNNGEVSPGDETQSTAAAGNTEWTAWGGNAAGTRYATAAQISPANVNKLEVAWTLPTGDTFRPGETGGIAFEAVPLKIRDSLYFCTPHGEVISADADNGKINWRFDPKANLTGVALSVCRGVSYHADPSPAAAGRECAETILWGTVDARLIAVDAKTGHSCAAFGKNGQIDLREGMGEVRPGYYYVTSPPAIVGNLAIAGALVLDGQSAGEPSGVIRAFDIKTGALAWAWDMGRPDRSGLPPPGETYTRGTANAWSVLSADPALGLVYVPTGVATPDYFGGKRSAAADKYGNSVIAIDVKTGKPRWSFQVVHHDLWDIDVSSQPVLTDFDTPQGKVPALISVSKSGQMFVLDRRNGKPLVETIEKPVPQGAVIGDHVSPTQPFSTGMPSFSGPELTEERMWGLTPIDQLFCRIQFRKLRYEGHFTPPSLGGTIQTPGFGGGVNWGSIAVDEGRHIAVVNNNLVPTMSRFIPRVVADKMGMHAAGDNGQAVSAEAVAGGAPQMGTPFAVKNGPFFSPLQVPCAQPPFGRIAAVDLDQHKLLWSHPLGKADKMGPMGLHSMLPFDIGLPMLGGAVTTQSGLTFIGATPDGRFRAYETRTGKLLWSADLPAAANSSPMTYIGKSGRQYVLIAAGGSQSFFGNEGNVLVAFALPTTDGTKVELVQ